MIKPMDIIGKVGEKKPSQSDGDASASRRTFLARIGSGTGVATLSGISGCASLLGRDPLTVGYVPSFRTLQGPVMKQKGYLDELDVSIEARNYRVANGNLGVDYADGAVEVALETVKSAVFKRRSDHPGRITAANNVNDCLFLAGNEFAQTWADRGPDAFAAFQEQHGELFTLGQVTPELTALWMDAIGVSQDLIELAAGGNSQATRVQFQNGALDGVFTSIPTPTKLAQTDVALEEIAWVGDAVSNQPGGVTVMSDELRNDQPEVARALLEKHARATKFINEQPDEAAQIASTAIGDEVSTDLARSVLQTKTANFVTDPRPIVEETNAIIDYLADYDLADESLDAEDVIDPSLYADIA